MQYISKTFSKMTINNFFVWQIFLRRGIQKNGIEDLCRFNENDASVLFAPHRGAFFHSHAAVGGKAAVHRDYDAVDKARRVI